MKVLLIYPPRKLDSYCLPPVGLMYIAQAIEEAGHTAEIVDIPYLITRFPRRFDLANESIYEYLYSLRGDIIGLSGIVSSYGYYERFTKKIRKFYKDVPIIVGGNVGVPIKDIWEEYTDVDYLVQGDGEDVIKLFLQFYLTDRAKIQTIPGLFYRREGKFMSNPPLVNRRIDEIPFLSYDRIDYEYYATRLEECIERNIPDKEAIRNKNIRPFPLLTTRGCPYECTFCFHFTRTYLAHSVNYVINNILFLHRRYNANTFFILDDLFIADEERTLKLCQRLKELNLNLSIYATGGKPSLITKRLLREMRDAGFIRFSYGIESGSERMLNIMNKKVSVSQNHNALKWTKEVGLQVIANLVFGMPGEDRETIEETKKFLMDLNFNSKQISINWATAYPGSGLFNWMLEKGLVEDVRKYILEVGSVGQYLINFTTLSKRELFKEIRRLTFEIDKVYYFRRGEWTKYYKTILAYYTYTLRRAGYYLCHPGRFRIYLRKQKRIWAD